MLSYPSRRGYCGLTCPKQKDFYKGLNKSCQMNDSSVCLPGLGMVTSKISNLSLSQPFHKVGGAFQRKTFPPRKIQDEVMTRPSASSIPAGETFVTCTGGGGPPSSTFSNPERLANEDENVRVEVNDLAYLNLNAFIHSILLTSVQTLQQ